MEEISPPPHSPCEVTLLPPKKNWIPNLNTPQCDYQHTRHGLELGQQESIAWVRQSFKIYRPYLKSDPFYLFIKMIIYDIYEPIRTKYQELYLPLMIYILPRLTLKIKLREKLGLPLNIEEPVSLSNILYMCLHFYLSGDRNILQNNPTPWTRTSS